MRKSPSTWIAYGQPFSKRLSFRPTSPCVFDPTPKVLSSILPWQIFTLDEVFARLIKLDYLLHAVVLACDKALVRRMIAPLALAKARLTRSQPLDAMISEELDDKALINLFKLQASLNI